MSTERIQDPSSVLSEEQEVEVRVLAINGSKLNLSMREQVNVSADSALHNRRKQHHSVLANGHIFRSRSC